MELTTSGNSIAHVDEICRTDYAIIAKTKASPHTADTLTQKLR